MLRAVLLTTALVAPGQLFAQATDSRAAEIAAELQRFLPEAPGLVSVTAQSETYLVSLDLSALSDGLPASNSFDFSPFDMRLRETADGRFEVSYDQNLALVFHLDGIVDFRLDIDAVKGEGVFDPALGAFVNHEFTLTNLAFEQSMLSPGESGKVSYRIDSLSGSSKSRPAAGSGIDYEMDYVARGLFEEVKIPGGYGQPALDFTLKVASYSGSGTMSGGQALPVLDLIAWFVGNAGADDLNQKQTEAKALLSNAAPFFKLLSGDAKLADLAVDTPMGTFTAGSVDVSVILAGAVADGRFYERLAFENIGLPSGLLDGMGAGWAAPFVPKGLELSFEVTEFDLANPLKILIDSVDWNRGPDGATEFQMLQALLPKGEVLVDFGLGAGSATYSLTTKGTLNAGPMGNPSGKGQVRVGGIDAVLTALRSAPPEIGNAAVPAIGMARGLARVEGSEIVWDVELTETGGLFVNGNDLSMFLQ